jgi:predicted Rossmann fold nucleotide-binding protein DprA/Smf involved in DNA uptake
MTKNAKRKADQVDAANPRAENKWGHILELVPTDGDHAAASFRWDVFLMAGNPAKPEQGRNVCAVPGTIFAPGAEGTNRLIQYGAKLVHDVNDILEEVPGSPRLGNAPEITPDSPLRAVLEVFSRDEATHIDAAAATLKTSVAAVSEAVLQLELGGWLQALPGSRWTRIR